MAEALRKRGALEQATAVATQGVATSPEYLPGRIVMARIYQDQGEWRSAAAELEAARLLDPSHPVVLDAIAEVAARLEWGPRKTVHPTPTPLMAPVIETVETVEAVDAESVEEMVFTDEGDDSDSMQVSEPVLTESLAMLYRGQGHLEQAVEVLNALVARAPANAELAARRDALRAELEESRPRPFDATRSGGRPVRDWLSSLATARVAPTTAASSFDAFYQPPPPAPSEAGDLEAFQAWLKDLDR